MGHPRRLRKKYSTPGHPYGKERIEEENKLKHEYGLKSNREVWKAKSEIRKYRAQAREIQADKSERRKERETELLNKVKKMGMITEGGLDEVLAIKVNNYLDRRLQTLVYKKGLAKTIKQARQLITHGHIAVNGRKVNVPGFIVEVSQEGKIGYYGKAPELEEKPSQPESETKEIETKPKVPQTDTKPRVPEPTGGEGK